MRSAAILASAVTFAASVTAQVPGFAAMSEPTQDEQVAAGKPFTIKWSAGKYTGPVDVVLLAGASPSTLVPGPTLASGLDVTAGSYAWNVDCSLGKDVTYGIKIVSEGNAELFQYSFPFHINNSGCGSTPKPTETGYPTAPKPTETGYPTAPKPTETGYPTAPKPTTSSAPPAVTTSASYSVPPVPMPTIVPGSSSSFVSVPSGYPVPPSSSVAPSASSSVPAAPTSTIPVTAGAGRVAGGSLALAAAVAALVI